MKKLSYKKLNFRYLLVALFALVTMGYLSSCRSIGQSEKTISLDDIDTDVSGLVYAQLTYAPEVPKPISYRSPKRVKVELTTEEKVMELTDGTSYTFWTFNGHVPGPFIRVRQGDLIDFTLRNSSSSKHAHSIDMHAVTGPGGGAVATQTAPGQFSHFEFRAMRAGLYIYHCATAPVPLHIANGMYGLILVEPQEGMPEVDREYYLLQSEFYTKGDFAAKGLQNFDRDKAIDEEPDYVVFNGYVNSTTGKNALEAQVGETVRLYVGNAGPSLISSFHPVGQIFSNVYQEGGTLINHNVQTTTIPVGGAVIAEMEMLVPETIHLIDHSIFRAYRKGATAEIEVVGDENPDIYSAK